MHIAMLSIHVSDPAAAHAFYTGPIGLETVMAAPEANLFIVRNPGADHPGLLLEPGDSPVAAAYATGLREAGLPALVLGTEELDADLRRLREAGVRIVGDVVDSPAGRFVLFDDTVGNLVQLHEAPPEPVEPVE
ncbi:MAG: VOC family protein [Pseudoclavibacter sp.]|nr:VOC family protein [Pseudoclavibacter sp.]